MNGTNSEHRYFEMATVDLVLSIARSYGRRATVTGSGATFTHSGYTWFSIETTP